MSTLDELARELGAVGIRGRLRRRILLEAADHLAEAPDAPFGDPRLLAAEFAEAVGAAKARRAARSSFAALVVVAAAYAIAFVSLTRANRDIATWGGLALAAGVVFLPQVAFVGGLTALVARSPRYALRRAGLGLLAGGGSLACALALGLDAPWIVAPGLAAVAAALVPTLDAARIRTAVTAPELTLTSGQALLLIALAAAACGIAGASGGDPLEGVRNALVESVAAASGFALLGRAIGIRR